MAGAFAPLLPPVAAFAANVTLQVLLVRNGAGRGLLRSLVVACAAGVPVLLAGELAVAAARGSGPAEALPLAAANLLAYGSLSYCYFHLVNLGETARRIRILREIRNAGGALTLDGIRARYGAAEMLARRIARLTGTGQIVLAGGRYRVGRPVMRLLADILVALKIAYLGRRSEFQP